MTKPPLFRSREKVPAIERGAGAVNEGLILQTNRLNLRILGKSSADIVLSFFQRNRDFLKEWEPVREEAFFSLPLQRRMLADELHAMAEGTLFKVWMFERDDHQFQAAVGTIALNNIVRGCFHSCHLGYRLDQSKTGKGYMAEGLRRVIDYAFNGLSLHRIEANIMPRNTASLRVAERLGFENEGIARKYLKIDGRWEDHIHMVLLNEGME